MRSLLLVVVLALTSTSSAENWVRFRGPNGQGISSETNLPLRWSAEENVSWKTPIPGEGFSSPIVYNDHVLLTTATEGGKSCRVLCVNRKNGDVRWNVEVHRQIPGKKRQDNSYATPTPVTDGTYVYAVFADGTMVAVDFKGQRVWKNTDVRFHSLHGLGASPLFVDGQVIMPFDGNSPDENTIGWKQPWKEAVILSVNASDGKTRWTARRGNSRVGHVTPILINDGERFVSAAGDCVQGFDTATGKRIWTVFSQGEGVTPSPVLGEGLLFTSSGFEAPTIRAIRLGGEGDVTDTHIAWEQKQGAPVLPSILYVRPHLYVITRDDIMYCLQASSGDVVWRRRMPGKYSASPVLADGRIYILEREKGITHVLQPGDRYNEIATNTLGERCLASMAVSQGQFFVRTEQNLYCIGTNH